MPRSTRPLQKWVGLPVLIAGSLALVVACGSQPPAEPVVPAGSPAVDLPALPPGGPPPAALPSSPPATAPQATRVLKPLKANPESGPVGTAFVIAGEGLPPGQPVEIHWATWEGSYVTEAGPENVRFFERKFVDKRLPLGTGVVDAEGRLRTALTAPEDYGEVHDLYAVADGQDVARGGFRVMRTVEFTPAEGPVGTPINITVKGMGWKPFENTMGLRYDNKYAGFVSAVTTRGTAAFQLRAAGSPGKHVVQLTGASPGMPYLNLQQSPVAHVPAEFQWTFTVTRDPGAPPDTLDWPDGRHVAAISAATPRTTAAGGGVGLPGLAAKIEPAAGPILSQATMRASGLTPGTETLLEWVTARGNRLVPSGWSLSTTPLLKTATGPDGSLAAGIQVPDDLGGWHVVRLLQGEKVAAEIPYFVERSMVGLTPKRVKAGENVTLQIKGIGWTELDNGVAITYDNAYIGYACGFNSNGDITLDLVATGGPGTHLIDLYPMIYRAKGNHPAEYWNFQLPHLTALQDGPGLALGYNLPIFRLAVEVIE